MDLQVRWHAPFLLAVAACGGGVTTESPSRGTSSDGGNSGSGQATRGTSAGLSLASSSGATGLAHDGGAGGASGCDPSCTNGCAGGTCEIDCSDSSCMERKFRCPAGMPCTLTCTGDMVCLADTLTCPQNAPCDVRCSGRFTCTDLVVRGAQVGSLTVSMTATCSGPEACSAADFECAALGCSVTCSDGAGPLGRQVLHSNCIQD